MCIEFRYMNYSEQHQLLHLTVCCWPQEVTPPGTNVVQAVFLQWKQSSKSLCSNWVYCFFLNALTILLYFFSSSAAPQKPVNGTVLFRVASPLGTDRVCCVLERCRILNLGLLHRSQVRYHWDSSPSRIYLYLKYKIKNCDYLLCLAFSCLH